MKNVGKTDMNIRFIIGFILLILGLHYRNPWWFVLAVLVIFSGAMQYCPLYHLFKINTIEKKAKSKKIVVKKAKKSSKRKRK